MNAKQIVTQLAEEGGIKINGENPWDPQVHNEDFYMRLLQDGALGLGESYMDGWWDCKEPSDFICKLFEADLDRKIKQNWKMASYVLGARIMNMQSKARAFMIGDKHYDHGNDLYTRMLGKYLAYSCGYWRHVDESQGTMAENHDKAQEAKYDIICRKLELKPGMSLLDIGCGWGTLLKYAAEKYGVSGVGTTVSKEQVPYAEEICKGLPLKFYYKDYREPLNQKFDRIVSVGMLCHVGYKNFRSYMKAAHDAMKDDGMFLLHHICCNVSRTQTDPWTHRYIFRNGMLPSMAQISKAAEGYFTFYDAHHWGGVEYDKTLIAWRTNFLNHWPEIKEKYGERFKRMFVFYLSSCAGMFRANRAQILQSLFGKYGREYPGRRTPVIR